MVSLLIKKINQTQKLSYIGTILKLTKASTFIKSFFENGWMGE